ncbi:hypothetical protein IJJ46_01475 [Candidatus Saccharibacteria bacterium]|nr:hypothetical protein [Candidatus Saccharibacteria bacterium]
MIRKYGEKYLVPEASDTDWLQYGIHSKTLPLVIAPEDYVNPETGKRYFTWDEIMELQIDGKLPTGWRLPTKEEAEGLIAEFSADPEDGQTASSTLMDRLALMPNGWIMPYRMEQYARELEHFADCFATARGGRSGLAGYWTSMVDAEREEQYLLHGYRGEPKSFYNPSILGRYAYILAATREGRLEVTTFSTDHGLTVRLVHEVK